MMDWVRDFFHWTEDDSYSDCLIDVVHALVLLVIFGTFVFGLIAIGFF
jgi:hypothetical protein